MRNLVKAGWATKSLTTKIGIAVLVFLCCSLVRSVRVQSQTLPSRITETIDDTSLVTVENSTDMRIATATDDGLVSPDLPMERILLTLKSSPEQEAALEQLLAEQQDPSSPNYQQWLTPEEFGESFGASSQELGAVVGWLTQHGLTVDNIANNRREIEFSGTASQVEETFHTEIHQYESEGETHIANATDISIPMALTPLIGGVVGLHDFRAQSMMTWAADGYHSMSPRDFATIYNVTSLWNQGFDGKGQSIAIVGRTNINLSDVRNFRAQFGLPTNDPQIIVNGVDPGIVSPDDEGEADLDVEWAGAVAKGATIKLVVSKSTGTTDGAYLSAQYIVDHNLAPIVSASFGVCEKNTSIGNLWQQAAAQGMSVFVASGDSGSATCDSAESAAAKGGLAVNGLASTPYNVAVGGTRFNDNGTYWNRTNNFLNLSSARGYIPETVWNDRKDFGVPGLWSGGGVSSFWPQPSWQVGFGVPTADPGTTTGHHRYLPDISLSASGHDGYVIRQEGHVGVVFGTSASAPAFAGIMAMINQMTGQTNGNPNPRLYAIANQSPSIFHDITTGSNAVPCVAGSIDCSNGLTTGYNAGPGYDLVTGWGSVDAYALAQAWKP